MFSYSVDVSTRIPQAQVEKLWEQVVDRRVREKKIQWFTDVLRSWFYFY